MSSIDERRAEFQRYKEDVKKRGKPFYPFAMVEDTVMSLVVVVVIAGLAWIWKTYDILGPLIGPKADPGTISFVPRPDWYFYFLFYPAADLQVAGVGDPGHDRDPDPLPRPAARAAVRRHA
jgi:quinol-cytochrome oxidoreductase complex cytochrome b subunit